jgi:EAL domain-containing protein (putative c-di-GMP-specific phosphodiesterase class I)
VQVLAATVALAHDLGLRVTVEGVETPAQHTLMRELGVDLAQGWHYGVPADAESTAKLFR